MINKISRTNVLDFDMQVACDKGAEVELLSPNGGVATGILITIVGKDSKLLRDYAKNKRDKDLAKDYEAKKKGKDFGALTVAEALDAKYEQIFACMNGWRHVARDLEGKIVEESKTLLFGTEKPEELAFSLASVKKFFGRCPWAFLQIEEEINNYANFTKN